MIDPSGNTLARLSEITEPDNRTISRPVNGEAPDVLSWQRITEIMPTGVKAIDALLTCGKGQRLGILPGRAAVKRC